MKTPQSQKYSRLASTEEYRTGADSKCSPLSCRFGHSSVFLSYSVSISKDSDCTNSISGKMTHANGGRDKQRDKCRVSESESYDYIIRDDMTDKRMSGTTRLESDMTQLGGSQTARAPLSVLSCFPWFETADPFLLRNDCHLFTLYKVTL